MSLLAIEPKPLRSLTRFRPRSLKIRSRRHSGVRRLGVSGLIVVLTVLAGASAASATGWGAPQLLLSFAGFEQADVSCSSASFCVSVGSLPKPGQPIGQPTPNPPAPGVEVWNGSRWVFSVAPQPNPGGAALFKGVSCVGTRKSISGGVAASVCYAVGYYSTGSTFAALIEFFDGSSWSIQPVQLPSGTTFSTLSRVSCTSSADLCMAVGTFRTASGGSTLAEVWNGSTWTPSPQTVSNAALNSVSCTSPAFCAAVGIDAAGDLAEVYDGSRWVVQTAPGLGVHGSTGDLTSVSCTSSTACVAVGSYQGNGVFAPGKLAQAQIYNGSGSWSANDPGSPGQTFSTLGGVSCSPTTTGSPATCWAVGVYDAPGGPKPPGRVQNDWGEYWNGSSWQFASVPTPTTGTNPGLAAVSCPASALSGFCTAAGSYLSSNGFRPFANFYTIVITLPPRCCGQLIPKFYNLSAHGAEKHGATITAVLRKPRALVLLVRVRVRHRLVTVGLVPLGLHRAGRSKIHWNLLVNGRPLPAGRYQVSLHSNTDSVLSPPTPPGARTLTVLANGQVRAGR